MNFTPGATTSKPHCAGFTSEGRTCWSEPKEDGLCTRHLSGRRRRQANDAERKAQWDERTRIADRQQAQRDAVKAWREAHPQQVWCQPWVCPICNVAIQTLPMTAENKDIEQQAQERGIKRHQLDHGDDWTAYETAGLEDQPTA